MPLPYLNIIPREADPLPLNPKTRQAIDALLKNAPNPEINYPPPYIFAVDAANGSDYQLASILDQYFILKNWAQAQAELEKYLLVNRPPEPTARANFYLAQTLCFQEKYDESLYKFLETMDYFPSQSQIWIQTVLLQLNLSR